MSDDVQKYFIRCVMRYNPGAGILPDFNMLIVMLAAYSTSEDVKNEIDSVCTGMVFPQEFDVRDTWRKLEEYANTHAVYSDKIVDFFRGRNIPLPYTIYSNYNDNSVNLIARVITPEDKRHGTGEAIDFDEVASTLKQLRKEACEQKAPVQNEDVKASAADESGPDGNTASPKELGGSSLERTQESEAAPRRVRTQAEMKELAQRMRAEGKTLIEIAATLYPDEHAQWRRGNEQMRNALEKRVGRLMR